MAYDPGFIAGESVPLPTASTRLRQRLLAYGQPVSHRRFSFLFDIVRCQAICTAHNLDGSTLIPAGVIDRRDDFRFDPHVPAVLQIDNNRGYRNNDWDRGHLVMRRAMHWGDEDVARQADSESFYWTNISPQHSRLHDTAWGSIEDWVLQAAEGGGGRACVFCGPVMTDDDPEHVNQTGETPVRIPAGFWKIMVLRHAERLSAAAFLVWQRDFDSATPLPFDPTLEQVRVSTLEYLTALDFGALRFLDPLRFGTTPQARHSSDAGPRSRSASGDTVSGDRVRSRRALQVQGPEDLLL